MVRGFISGLVWGALVAVAMVLVASELAIRHDIPRGPQAGAVEVPAGSGFAGVRSDLPPSAPAEPAAQPAARSPVPGVAAPASDAPAGLPVPDAPSVPATSDVAPASAPDAGAEPEPDLPAPDAAPGSMTAPGVAVPQPDAAPSAGAAPRPSRVADPEPALDAGRPQAPVAPVEGGPVLGAADTPPEMPADPALAAGATAEPPPSVDRPRPGMPQVETAAPVAPGPPADSASGAAAPALVGAAEQPVPPAAETAPDLPATEAGQGQAEGPAGISAAGAPDAAPTAPVEAVRPATPEVATEVTVPAMPGGGAEDTPAPAVAPDDGPAASRPDAPGTVAEAGAAATAEPAPGEMTTIMTPGQAAAAKIETGRLPQAGVAAPDGASDAASPAAEVPAAPAPDALTRNAADFDNPEGLPTLSIVLVDGGDLPVDLPFPATFALDPTSPEAMLRAQVYRAGGHEVVVLPALPAGATASDAAQAIEASRALLELSVAIMDRPEGTLQDSREALEQVVIEAGLSGHGLLTIPRGLNTAQRVAQREGVVSAVVFRDIDAEDQDSGAVKRFLDQAAFRARQEGAVVVLARVRPETITGLAEWVLGNRAQSVSLAPVSVALRAGAGL